MVVLSFVKRWCNTLTLAEKATPCLFLWVFMDFCAYVRTYGASPLAGRGVRRDLANCPRSFFSPLAPEGGKKEEVNSPGLNAFSLVKLLYPLYNTIANVAEPLHQGLRLFP